MWDIVSMAVDTTCLLENMATGWRLNARQSTWNVLIYRRREGEVLITNHN
jgi:hypothetical protein